jgi:predicted phage terminase large subunit-like protein
LEPDARTGPDKEQLARALLQFQELAKSARTDDEARTITRRIAQIVRTYRIKYGIGIADSPVEQALEVDEHYVIRPHIAMLSDRISKAVKDVERGTSRHLAISMPPRSGKSTLTSLYSPLWMLRQHPEWKIVMTSYDGGLTTAWSRQIRHFIEDRPQLGIALARDGGAGGRWSTVEGGGMYSVGIGGALTGRGAKVLIIDDPVSDFAAAHSPRIRSNLWNWWLSVAQTRLEPPYLVLVTMTRWHEDDFVGRLLSDEHEGNPEDWERIVLPAIADREDDWLGRALGEPLYSPLLEETAEEALQRWADVKRTVGSYTFAAMYQQRPSPAQGAIFDIGWWRYWTTDPSRADGDRTVYVPPQVFERGEWMDSWDFSFKGGAGSDFVVGQRWMMDGANRYLIAQRRGRWSFTETIDQMLRWAKSSDQFASPYGHLVHRRLFEDAANGAAIADTLKAKVPGLKGIRPRTSKVARARAITPEIESGNVYLPHPADEGNSWVQDLLSELRNFPNDAHDDQVDALTQALLFMRTGGKGIITNPARMPSMPPRNLTTAARTDAQRRRMR